MRKSSVLSILIVSLSTPALAADADLKQQVEQIGSAYADSFNKQDAAGIAATFATGGITSTRRAQGRISRSSTRARSRQVSITKRLRSIKSGPWDQTLRSQWANTGSPARTRAVLPSKSQAFGPQQMSARAGNGKSGCCRQFRSRPSP
jgi:hypothetical protein